MGHEKGMMAKVVRKDTDSIFSTKYHVIGEAVGCIKGYNLAMALF